MPIQIKIGLIIGLAVSSFFFGVKYQKGQGAIVENGAIKTNIQDHNTGQKEIGEKVRYVEKEKIIYKDKIIKVPAADISKPCPIDEFTRVRRDVFGALPGELFESTD